MGVHRQFSEKKKILFGTQLAYHGNEKKAN